LGDGAEQIELIDQQLRDGNNDAAIQLLVKLIVKYAGECNFDKAEELRSKLIEVDSMAVNEIVKTGEVIEAAKESAIDKEHLAIWADFYENLTPEEANALFYSMSQEKHPANFSIYRQGEMRSRLYFIDEGSLKIFYRQHEKTLLLKTLGPGDLFGEDTFFFSDAFCTTSVITDSPAKLYVLLKDDLDKVNLKTPALESKLNGYCASLASVADLIKSKHLERRIAERLTLSGKVLVQMLNESHQPAAKAFNAELLDISTRGVAFLMKTTEKDSARLLGRNLSMKITFEEPAAKMGMTHIGSVVGVNSEPFNEYAVHVEFNEYLASSVITDLENLIKPSEE